jgi:hypothetical protein
MFVDELKTKLKLEDVCSFAVTIFEDKHVVIEGVKKVVFKGENQIKFRTKKRGICIDGEGLLIREIGDGNVIVSGVIKEVEYD